MLEASLSLESQLASALINNQIDETLHLIQRTPIDNNKRYYFPNGSFHFLEYVIINGSLEMLRALLDLTCIRSNSMIFNSGLFCRHDKLELVLNHPLIDLNASLQCPYDGKITLIQRAFGNSTPETFEKILNHPKLDIPVYVPINHWTTLSHSSEIFILDWMRNNIYYHPTCEDKMNCLIKYYAMHMVYHPQKFSEIFQANPALPQLLSSYSPAIWNYVKAQVHHLNTSYFQLLDDIASSKEKQASLQHPLYRIFSLYDSNLISSALSFFSMTQPLLREISEKIESVKGTVVLSPKI